jgi:hypothetical protein
MRVALAVSGTVFQFTCFTGTKVQILTNSSRASCIRAPCKRLAYPVADRERESEREREIGGEKSAREGDYTARAVKIFF